MNGSVQSKAILLTIMVLASTAISAEYLAGASAQTSSQAQLSALVQAAGSSRAYAVTAIGSAGVNGLSTAQAQASLTAGDALLAGARSDLQAGTDLSQGILQAEGAMRDYTAAASYATASLDSAGLTASVNLEATEESISQVNATISVVSQASAKVCTGISLNGTDATLLQEDCARVDSGLTNATAHLNQAAGFAATAKAGVNVSSNTGEASLLVAKARNDVKASESMISTLAFFTYEMRGQDYYLQVISPLYAKANSSISAQESLLTQAGSVSASLSSALAMQASANANTSSLATAIGSVDTSGVSSSASAAQHTATEVSSNLSALDALVVQFGLTGTSSLLTSISTAESATTSFNSSVSVASTEYSSFSSSSIGGFTAYLSQAQSDQASVKNAGTSYLLALSDVRGNLSALIALLGALAPPSLLSANVTLAALATSATTTTQGLEARIEGATSAMLSVQAGIAATTSALTSFTAGVSNQSPVRTMYGISSSEALYLNPASEAQVTACAEALNSSAQMASQWGASVQTSLSSTVGGFYASSSSLVSLGSTVHSALSAASSDLSSVSALITSDIQMRNGAVATGIMVVAVAYQYFSTLNVSGGVTAMARAFLYFQTASATYA